MSDSDALSRYRRGNGELSKVLTPAQARAELAATRARAREQLAALEIELISAFSLREILRRHPVVSLLGAFAIGVAASRLFRRRR